jgi:organic hydroperoxide reductase OsmC/OhrA
MLSSLPVPSSPIKMTGKTLTKIEGVLGEHIKQLFVAGYAACFENA